MIEDPSSESTDCYSSASKYSELERCSSTSTYCVDRLPNVASVVDESIVVAVVVENGRETVALLAD